MRFVRLNRRGALRRALKLPCEVVREDAYGLVADTALDVSPDGLRVRTEADLQPGDLVVVSFRATAFRIGFHTRARVARVLEGRRAGDGCRSAALELTSLDAVSRLILRGALRNVPPPVPRRPQPLDYAASLGALLRA